MAAAAPCGVQRIVAVVAGRTVVGSMLQLWKKCRCKLSLNRSCKNLAVSPTRGKSEGMRAGVLPKLRLPGLQHSACRMSLLIISLLLLLSAEAVSDRCPRLRLQPDVDQNITIGKQLRIICSTRTSNSMNCSEWNISIIHNNQVLPLHKNKTHRKVALVNVTSAEDQGNYVCVQQSSCCEPRDNESLSVLVGYSPKKYTISIEKIVFENQQNLYVSFSVTAPGKDEDMITPKWFATIKSKIECKEDKLHNLTKTFSCYQHLYDDRFTNKTVIIEGLSLGLHQNHSTEVNISPNLLVKPAMVSGVEVVAAPRHLQVSWDASVGRPPLQQGEVGGLTHTLTYQSQFDPQPLEAQNVSCDPKRCRVQVSGLVPHTLYTLAISCRPNRDGFPSDPNRTEIRTLTDVPTRGPVLWPWSFTLAQGGKALAIYPLDIPEGRDRGGDIQEYVVVQYYYSGTEDVRPDAGNTCMSHVPQDTRLLQIFKASYHLLLPVPESSAQDRSLQLGVFATTTAGCSQKASPLQVQLRQGSQWKGWVDTVRTSEENFQVRFEPQEELSVEGRVHWCCPFYSYKSSDPPRCREELRTKELGVVSGSWSVDITVSHSCAMGLLPKFGVSLTRGQTSSGITWSSCTYESNRNPSKVSLDRMVYNDSEGALVLSWKMLCANKMRPLTYDVAVLAWDQVGLPSSKLCDRAPHDNVNASWRGMEVRKRGLTAPRYAVCIRENAAQGKGPWHITQLDIPSNIPGNLRTVVAVSTVTCVLVVFLIVLCICCWSRVKKKFSLNNKRRAVAFVDTSCDVHKVELFHLFEDDGIPVVPEEFFLKITSEDGSTRAFLDRGSGDGEDSGCRSEERHSADAYEGSAAVDYGFELQSESGPRTEDVDSGRHSSSNSNSSDHYVEQCIEDT